jgi:hypothetical protein
MKVKLICGDSYASAALVAVLGRNHGRRILAFDSCAEL